MASKLSNAGIFRPREYSAQKGARELSERELTLIENSSVYCLIFASVLAFYLQVWVFRNCSNNSAGSECAIFAKSSFAKSQRGEMEELFNIDDELPVYLKHQYQEGTATGLTVTGF